MKGTEKFKIAVAPDSFKGSLTALEAASHIETGFKKALKNIVVRKIPMADGGEGTVRAIVDATGGRLVGCRARDPLGRKVDAVFGISGDRKTAVIEMAAASGLGLLKPAERDPRRTSTRGTGELIRKALDSGVKQILIGIGGSATNDGGAGMARALGVKFLDRNGRPLPEGGGALRDLCRIDVSRLDPRLQGVDVEVACDVDNPLTGPHGAAFVYGPQKGASPAAVKELDAALRRYAEVIEKDLGFDVADVPGAGAAGGLGAGLMALVGGRLRPGVDIVIDRVGLRRRIQGCQLVVTGEGRMDAQTRFGKTPAGVARVAAEQGIPVIAISGCLGPGTEVLRSIGMTACFSALQEPVQEEDLPARAPEMLAHCAEQVARTMGLVGGREWSVCLRT